MKKSKLLLMFITLFIVFIASFFKPGTTNEPVNAINKKNNTTTSSNLLPSIKDYSDINEKTEPSTSNKIVEVSTYDQYYNSVKTALSNFDTNINIKIYNYNKNIFNIHIANKILKTHPNLNYGFKKIYAKITSTKSFTIMNVQLTYRLPKYIMVHMKNASQIKAREIISSIINPNMDELEKATVIHDYIVNNTQYDSDGLKSNCYAPEVFTDYGALINGKAVCEGYAKALHRLSTLVGIQSIFVTGYAKGKPHAWNILKLNGKYRHVDATFNDPITSSGKNILSHKYFNTTDFNISKDFNWKRTDYPICE